MFVLQPDEYDIMVRELGFEMKAQPSGRMKTEEELAKEEEERLRQLEVMCIYILPHDMFSVSSAAILRLLTFLRVRKWLTSEQTSLRLCASCVLRAEARYQQCFYYINLSVS